MSSGVVLLATSANFRLDCITIETRLLPLQILGKQASSAAFKTKACERMLRLESEAGIAQQRLRSFMTDMGTESSLWTIPNFEDPSQKYFPYILPVADCDHGLHHCMKETEDAYDEWGVYFKQLKGLSKLFGRRDSVDRWVKFNIRDNPRVPPEAKDSMAVMFKTTCPSLVQHRWLDHFEVLHWILQRQNLVTLADVKPDSDTNSETDLSQDEGDSLKRLISDPTVAARSWATAWVEYEVHKWGFSVYNYLHACPCHSIEEKKTMKQSCPWNGRRLVEIAGGAMEEFHRSLLSLRLDNSKEALKALNHLSGFDEAAARSLRASFEVAKNKVALRFRQATGYLTTSGHWLLDHFSMESGEDTVVLSRIPCSGSRPVRQKQAICKTVAGRF